MLFETAPYHSLRLSGSTAQTEGLFRLSPLGFFVTGFHTSMSNAFDAGERISR